MTSMTGSSHLLGFTQNASKQIQNIIPVVKQWWFTMVKKRKTSLPPPKKKITHVTRFILWRICFDVQNPSPPSSRCFPARKIGLQGTRRSFDPRRQTQWAKSSCQTSCNFPPSSAPSLQKQNRSSKKNSWDTASFHGKSCFFGVFSGQDEHVMVYERITTWYFYDVLNLEVSVELGNTTIVSPPSVWVTLGWYTPQSPWQNWKIFCFNTKLLSLRGWAVTTSWPWLFLLFSFEGFFLDGIWTPKISEGYRCFWGQPYRQPPNRTTSSYLLGGILFDSKSWPRYFCRSKKVPARIHGKLEH